MKYILYLFTTLLASSLVAQSPWDDSTAGQITYTNGNVGIGTNDPGTHRIEIVSEPNSSKAPMLTMSSSDANLTGINSSFILKNADLTDGNWSRMHFWNGDNSSGASIATQFLDHTPATMSADLVFVTKGNGDYAEKMRIRSDGNVGIGTTNPKEKLEVNGNIVTSKSNVTKIELVRHDWAGSHGILFNAYHNHTVDGSIGKLGNTYYSSDDRYGAGAGAIVFYGNEGKMDFKISPSSTGPDNAIDWGMPQMRITRNGKVGIGVANPDSKLTVNGSIHATEVKVDLSIPGPDYVFEADYNLPTLEETEAYIQANRHLPEVPSAKEMEANGIELGEMNMLLLKKVEELTLHTIQQQKLIEAQGEMIEELKKKLK